MNKLFVPLDSASVAIGDLVRGCFTGGVWSLLDPSFPDPLASSRDLTPSLLTDIGDAWVISILLSGVPLGESPWSFFSFSGVLALVRLVSTWYNLSSSSSLWLCSDSSSSSSVVFPESEDGGRVVLVLLSLRINAPRAFLPALPVVVVVVGKLVVPLV